MDTKSLPRLSEVTARDVRDTMSLDFSKWLSCLSETNLPHRASEVFLERYPHAFSAGTVRKSLETKAVIPVGSTTGADWAAPLVSVQPLQEAFVAMARAASLLGRIPGLRKVPFNVKVPIQSGDAGYVWVKQNDPKPASKLAFSTGITLSPLKAAAIVVVTRELTMLSVAGAEAALRDTLIAGLTSFTDKSFLDPTSSAVTDTRPGSITSGTTPVASTGNYPADVQSLLAAFFAGAPNAIDPVLVTNAAHGAAIRAMNGGGGVGLPVIVSEAAGGTTVALDPAMVFVADNGVNIDISREASIELVDNPVTPTGTTVYSSLFQLNLVGFRVERFLNWQAATGAVKYLAA